MSEASFPHRVPYAKPNGWWGMVIFIASEATLFGLLVGSYLYIRFQHNAWPPPGIPRPEVTAPLILTAALVATCVPLRLGFGAARRGRAGAACWLIGIAVVVQAGYLAMQMRLFEDDLQKFGPSHNAYGSIYYLILGVHHAHVVVGILLEVFLLARLLTGVTSYRLVGLQSTVVYWYFVSLAAVVVTGVVLSAA